MGAPWCSREESGRHTVRDRTATLVRERLLADGKYDDALAETREQVAACRELALRPDLHNLGLPRALIDLADLLDMTGYRTGAATVRAEARSRTP